MRGGGDQITPTTKTPKTKKKNISDDLINVIFSDKNAPTREALMMEVVLKDTEFAAHVSTK